MKVTIWRLTWSHATGINWLAMRQCDESLAQEWLEIFRKDESCATYEASRKMPKMPDNALQLARHPATF